MEKKYKYTIDGGSFSEEQREFYEENGYIVCRKLIPHKAIDECINRFLEICNEENLPYNVVKNPFLEKNNLKGERSVNKLQDFLYDDIFFDNVITNHDLIKQIQNITGSDVTAFHSMIINKPPDSSYEYSVHPIHQDLHYFPFRPANSVVAAWTALENVNVQNGCLYVIPGSHKLPLLPHGYPPNIKNKMYHGVQGYDHIPKLHIEMEKGDTILFHPLILHGSGPNLSQGFRKALTVHFCDSNMKFIDVKGTSQEFIAEEVIELAKKKIGVTKFTDFWKIKSRLVAGKPGSFQNLTCNL